MEEFHEAEGTSRTSKLRLVKPSESNTHKYGSIEEIISDYFKLEDLITNLERAKKALNEQLERGLAALDVYSMQIKLDGMDYELVCVTGLSHSCDWKRLRELHPTIYATFVEEIKSTHVEIQQMKDNPAKPF
jgi:predicted phage-related endonuclease